MKAVESQVMEGAPIPKIELFVNGVHHVNEDQLAMEETEMVHPVWRSGCGNCLMVMK